MLTQVIAVVFVIFIISAISVDLYKSLKRGWTLSGKMFTPNRTNKKRHPYLYWSAMLMKFGFLIYILIKFYLYLIK